MNTFHIRPSSVLAIEAEPLVRAFDPNTLIAVQGEEFNGTEYVSTVSPCPNQESTAGYCWTYVRAGDWLAEFELTI